MTAASPAPADARLVDMLLDAALDSPHAVTALVGVVLPLVVGAVSLPTWRPALRGALLALLALAASVVTEFAAQAADPANPLDARAVLVAGVATWITGHVAHTSLWHRTRLSTWLQQLGSGPAEPRDDQQDQHDRHDRHDVAATIARARGQTPPYGQPELVDDNHPPPTGRHARRHSER